MIPQQIWVTPVTYEGNDFPLGPTPEKANLVSGREYLVIDYLDVHDWNGESSVTLVNDDGEIWSLSNRHLRVTKIINLFTQEIILVTDWENNLS